MTRAELIAIAVRHVERAIERLAAIPGSTSSKREVARLTKLVDTVRGYASLSFADGDPIAVGALITTDDSRTWLVVDNRLQLPIPSTAELGVLAIQYLQGERARHVGDTLTFHIGRPGETREEVHRIVSLR